jgi:hypothetical protein
MPIFTAQPGGQCHWVVPQFCRRLTITFEVTLPCIGQLSQSFLDGSYARKEMSLATKGQSSQVKTIEAASSIVECASYSGRL